MTSNTRLRFLLLVLGIVAIAAVSLWKVEDENVGTPRTSAPKVADTVAIAQSPTAPVSDSEYNARLRQYGVLMLQRVHSSDVGAIDTASFYFVELSDSTQNLQKLGFIAAATLIDSSSRFTVLGKAVRSASISVVSPQLVASHLRETGSECTAEVGTPIRFSRATPEWVIGLAVNAGEALAPNIPDSAAVHSDSTSMIDALRIANSLPDTGGAKFEKDTIISRGPYNIGEVFHFTADGTDILVADARRTVQHRTTAEGKPQAFPVDEQRPFIAERAASNASRAYVVKWQFYGGGPDGESNTLVPAVALRLGADHLLTIYLSGNYEDGNGGVFVSRKPDGSWREVAQWVGGC